MHGGVEPQTLCVLQTPTRNPLMYEACILAGEVGYDPTLIGVQCLPTALL